MAEIQYVGFPKVTRTKVIKYGFIPRLKGGVDWFLTIVEPYDKVTVTHRMNSAKQAREMAELIASTGV